MRTPTTLILIAALAVPLTAPAASAQSLVMSRLFQTIDTSRDGAIDRGEFEAAMAKRFARLDTNRDGSLDHAEMEAARERLARRANAAQAVAENRFERRDRSRDGRITRAEFMHVPALFDFADRNRDGRLDKEELAAAADALAGR
ncbi:signal transduction protein [Aurantimonas aggregata]|uniref:Signal transduction protein n=1 Tax=Aurantimonas aggregata TaxID=2047720 RepID=A0A6L9ME87_9HYPH|nr:EF-hand domain-containing protein [Aurantimonas aggregata]NDV85892.1 signal transduction protein [Aurantimonas aggregata]